MIPVKQELNFWVFRDNKEKKPLMEKISIYFFFLAFSGPCIISNLIFPTRCSITQFIYFWKTALRVSGGISTHHREHTQLYLQYLVLVEPLLLPVAIVEEWNWCECGAVADFRQHPHRTHARTHTHTHTHTSSNSSTIATVSSHGLTSTRYFKYSCVFS